MQNSKRDSAEKCLKCGADMEYSHKHIMAEDTDMIICKCTNTECDGKKEHYVMKEQDRSTHADDSYEDHSIDSYD